jgi:hypothetical protein
MARDNLKCIMDARVAFTTGLLAVIAAATSFATVAIAQDTPSLAPTVLPAPVGHRQPRPSDLPPSLQREEQGNGPAQGGEQREEQGNGPAQDNAFARKHAGSKKRIKGEQARNVVPAFDTKKSCQEADVAAVVSGRTRETCLQSEEAARNQLTKSWGEFSAADKAECAYTAQIGTPSYADLLTCLEMRQDVLKLRETSPETTGVETTGDGGANSSRRKRR